MNIVGRLGVGMCGLGFIAACSAPPSSEDVEETEQRIELHDLGRTYGFAFVPSPPLQIGESLDVLKDRLTRHAFATQATGAVIAPYLDSTGAPISQFGSAVRFTCGATLISPSYVITAAHCVDSDSIHTATDSVALEMYRPASHLGLDATWRPKTALSGTFPAFVHDTYSAGDGYYTDRYSCTLSARCGSGSVNCPNDASAVDVALLHCDGRPGDRYGYLDVAKTENANAEVYVPWKHEVYDIPANAPTDSDAYLHYVQYPTAYADNYHYLDRNQLLPLESIPWPDGSFPRKVSDSTQLTIWSDALGCHGTSGAGFLQRNATTGAWELLGPTALGGSAFGALLCEHSPGIAPQPSPVAGQPNLAYSSVVQTRTVLSGSTAAWAADCATQPLGSFSLGGRSGCTRAQSGLLLASRAAYSDLDPWNSATLSLSAGTAVGVGSAQLSLGKSYRIALGLTPTAECVGGVCPEVVVRIGGVEVLRRTVPAAAGQTAFVGGLFTSTLTGSQPVSAQISTGMVELGELDIVANDGANSFDTGYERAEVALMVPSVNPKKPLPMRFTGDGAQGFVSLLYAGERLLLTRQATALQGTFSVGFTSSLPDALTCGLVGADGAVLVSTSCTPGIKNPFNYTGATPAAALFVEGAGAAEVEIDNLALSIDQVLVTPDFSWSVTPASGSVVAGAQASYKLTASPSGGFHDVVNLSVTGLPSNVTAIFSPTTIQGGSGSSTLTVSTTASTPPGTFTLALTGTSGGGTVTHATPITLTVAASPSIFINAGGSAASPFLADQGFSGGSTLDHANAINVSGVVQPAPVAVYQTARIGNFTGTFAGFAPGSSHKVRLHFAETFFSTAGSRVFNVSINGKQVLTKYDVFKSAGAKNKAVVAELTQAANSTGQYVVTFTSVVNNSLLSGISIQ
jgi:hypothetical protein